MQTAITVILVTLCALFLVRQSYRLWFAKAGGGGCHSCSSCHNSKEAKPLVSLQAPTKTVKQEPT